MWDRKRIKARGKMAFQSNYWRCVLVALILFAIIGGGASGRSSNHSESNDHGIYTDGTFRVGGTTFHYNTPQQIIQAFREAAHTYRFVLPVLGTALRVAALFGTAVKILLINPLEVGCSRFFLRNSEQPAELGELSASFQPSWIHNVVTLLLRDIFIVLWCFLLVIPGIIKAYAYRMTPYILAEHPEMSGTEALRLSSAMMRGHKWYAFMFDLSYLGWYLLDAITAGILGVFYVHPYKAAADAELYRVVSGDYFIGGADAPTAIEF